MNLIDVTQQFKSDDDCLAYLETMRWPDGIRCPVCGCNRVSKIARKTAGKNKRTRIYQCLEATCKQQFSATSGTIFNDSHLPLTKWFLALALIVDAKKSISANQLKEHLGIGSYRTAWYVAHRIRKAMENKTIEKLTGVVEIDETYVGGRHKRPQGGIDVKGFQGRSTRKKSVVIGLRQRSGPVKMVHVIDAKAETIRKVVEEHVHEDVEVILTDDYRAYSIALKKYEGKHLSINHSGGYYVTGIDGEVHTNTVESAFSLFKRAIIGNFHAVSIKHLHRYLSEFETRFNARHSKDRFDATLRQMLGIEPMPYRALTAGE
jgi:transposase-like protein